MQSKLLAILLSCVLIGCATTKTDTITAPQTVSSEIPIPTVDPLKVSDVQWKLMGPAEMQQFLVDHKDSNEVFVYTLDDQNMAVMVGNIQEMRRYIESQQAKIDYLLGIMNSRSTKGQ